MKTKIHNLLLKESYKNFKNFNAVTKQMRARNMIIGLENEAGIWMEKEEDIAEITDSYFQALFVTSNPSDFEGIL